MLVFNNNNLGKYKSSDQRYSPTSFTTVLKPSTTKKTQSARSKLTEQNKEFLKSLGLTLQK